MTRMFLFLVSYESTEDIAMKMKKAELNILENMLRDMDKKEAICQKAFGDALKGTMRAVDKKRADVLRKMLDFYKQAKWL